MQLRVIAVLLVSVALGSEQSQNEAARLLGQANASYAARRPQEAIRLFKEYLARYPDRPDVRVFLGAAYLNLGKTEEALQETRRALKLDRSYSLAHTLAGRIYAQRREWDPAHKSFDEALRLNPRDREAWYFSGRAYFDENRFGKAAEALQQCLAVGGAQNRVYENLGLALEIGRASCRERV